tara:strand:+ start:2856 stop:3431 length:576 start_codon:yes stop_codon:yes gene_type:complete
MLIGLTGVKQSGKDTVAEILIRHQGFLRFAFADKVKDVARDLWDLTETQVHGDGPDKELCDPRWGVSPRHLMQILGTEVARNAHVDTWIRWLHRNHLRDRLAEGSDCVITDCRFPNEANYVRGNSGIIVKVIRPDKEESGDSHASETGVKSIIADYSIVNRVDLENPDLSLANLHREVISLMRMLRTVSQR